MMRFCFYLLVTVSHMKIYRTRRSFFCLMYTHVTPFDLFVENDDDEDNDD